MSDNNVKPLHSLEINNAPTKPTFRFRLNDKHIKDKSKVGTPLTEKMKAYIRKEHSRYLIAHFINKASKYGINSHFFQEIELQQEALILIEVALTTFDISKLTKKEDQKNFVLTAKGVPKDYEIVRKHFLNHTKTLMGFQLGEFIQELNTKKERMPQGEKENTIYEPIDNSRDHHEYYYDQIGLDKNTLLLIIDKIKNYNVYKKFDDLQELQPLIKQLGSLKDEQLITFICAELGLAPIAKIQALMNSLSQDEMPHLILKATSFISTLPKIFQDNNGHSVSKMYFKQKKAQTLIELLNRYKNNPKHAQEADNLIKFVHEYTKIYTIAEKNRLKNKWGKQYKHYESKVREWVGSETIDYFE